MELGSCGAWWIQNLAPLLANLPSRKQGRFISVEAVLHNVYHLMRTFNKKQCRDSVGVTSPQRETRSSAETLWVRRALITWFGEQSLENKTPSGEWRT